MGGGGKEEIRNTDGKKLNQKCISSYSSQYIPAEHFLDKKNYAHFSKNVKKISKI